MFQDFNKMSAHSKIWIYQSDRNLTAKEENMAAYFLKEVLQNWEAHGAALLTSAEILHSRFVIIAVDESHHAASGCSIDTSANWMKDLGAKLGVDFFDRSVTYFEDNVVKSIPVFEAKKAVTEGLIQADTVVFNNSITNLSLFMSAWRIPAIQFPFIKRFFSTETV